MKIIILFFSLAHIVAINAMHQDPSEPLMPDFELSASAEQLITRIEVGHKVILVENQSLIPQNALRIQLLNETKRHIGHPTAMPDSLLQALLNEPTVIEALLKIHNGHTRNEYIAALCFRAAHFNNIKALQFFIDRKLQVPKVRCWGISLADAARCNVNKEALALLLAHGAQFIEK